MRILLTNNHLADLGGTETWVMTMAEEYERLGYEVGVHTKHKGAVSSMLHRFIDDNPTGYDLALINHNTCISVDAKYKIFTSHGTEPQLEKPEKGCDEYVAVSENVAKKYDLKHIIKNPINTDKFRPYRPINKTPQKALVLGGPPPSIPTIYPSRVEDSMADLINNVDVVVSLGRGALEAMSCGRNVITWGHRSNWGSRGDGYLDDLSKLKGNVAGEYLSPNINLDEELSKYDKSHGERNRRYILDNHDVKNIAQEYIKIWQTNTKNAI